MEKSQDRTYKKKKIACKRKIEKIDVNKRLTSAAEVKVITFLL